MPHRYRVREIAQESGLSEATVDRVLNHWPAVRENAEAEIAGIDATAAAFEAFGRPRRIFRRRPRRRQSRFAA